MPQQLPRIDKSTLPEYLQNSPRVSVMAENLQEFLVQPGSLDKIYFHERSHLYYFRKIHPTAKFVPPCIWYDKEKRQYYPVKGAVDTEGFGMQCDEARLLASGKAAVSGGIMLAVRNLQSGTPKDLVLKGLGDDEDQDDFRTSCEAIRNVSPQLPKLTAMICRYQYIGCKERRNALILTAGGFFTFGGYADLLKGLSIWYRLLYIFAAFLGMFLTGL
jgi:hypothetical protein